MKKFDIRNNKGITLASLMATVIILLIMASIVVKFGTDSIDEANIQNIKTNMLLIEAKAKEYVESANYELGVDPNNATDQMKENANNQLKGTKVTSEDSIYSSLESIGIDSEIINEGTVYKMSTEDLVNMGIKGVKSDDSKGWYIVAYDIKNSVAKIYNSKGIKIDKDIVKYCLDDIRDI